MYKFYRNIESGKTIYAWEYDMLDREEKESYRYLGWFCSEWEAKGAELPPPYDGHRVKVGDTVMGLFRGRLMESLRIYTYPQVGTVIEEDRNRFKVKYPGMRLPWDYGYVEDVGKIVFID